jgi:transposase
VIPKEPRLLLLWDGATYHKDQELQAFLSQVNQGLEEKDWLVTLLSFAPNAPEQNPVEDIWLAGKNHLRRNFAVNKTFTQVKESFGRFLKDFFLKSVKFNWYTPELLHIT